MYDLSVGFPSCQLVVVFMGFFCIICCFTVRVNLSVALLTMINNTYLQQLETEDTNASHTTNVCFAANITNDKKVFDLLYVMVKSSHVK